MKSHATDKQRVELHNYLKSHGSATTTDIRHKLARYTLMSETNTEATNG
jgi:hypothetical protein